MTHDEFLEKHAGLLACSPACGEGWLPLLDRALTEMAQVIAYTNTPVGDEGFQVTTIKEKYGTLRLYTTAAPEAVYAIIDQAEAESAKTCEHCGAPGRIRNDRYWLKTLCNACDAKEAARYA